MVNRKPPQGGGFSFDQLDNSLYQTNGNELSLLYHIWQWIICYVSIDNSLPFIHHNRHLCQKGNYESRYKSDFFFFKRQIKPCRLAAARWCRCVRMCHGTQSCVCDVSRSHMWHDVCICVTWLIRMWDMTHWYVRDVTNSYVWHDAFICVTWLIRMCDMRHS